MYDLEEWDHIVNNVVSKWPEVMHVKKLRSDSKRLRAEIQFYPIILLGDNRWSISSPMTFHILISEVEHDCYGVVGEDGECNLEHCRPWICMPVIGEYNPHYGWAPSPYEGLLTRKKAVFPCWGNAEFDLSNPLQCMYMLREWALGIEEGYALSGAGWFRERKKEAELTIDRVILHDEKRLPILGAVTVPLTNETLTKLTQSGHGYSLEGTPKERELFIENGMRYTERGLEYAPIRRKVDASTRKR